jgi:pyruvate,water dikinase
LFLRDEGKDPYKRQQRSVERRQAAIDNVINRIGGLKHRIFRWALNYAQMFTQMREDSIFDIGLAYPSIRRMLAELGRRFAQAGAIDKANDIYWLTREEVIGGVSNLDSNLPIESLSLEIDKRKTNWNAHNLAIPPQQLPQKTRVMGIKTDAFMPVSEDEQSEHSLRGVAASPGQVTGIARVMLNQEDFSQMQPGDILVAEITTPAWTPLFTMAAGVVTDIGGPLSHGSIVAREYAIPAVLGTGVATQRIRNGQTITVDGDTGTVSLI